MYIECFQHSLAHRRALLNLPDNLATRGQRMIPKQNSIASFVPRITRVLRLQTHKCRPLSSPSDSLPTVRETRIVPLGVTSRNVFSIGQIPSFLSRLRSINYLWHNLPLVRSLHNSLESSFLL